MSVDLAREFLAAARYLLDGGFNRNAVSCAYYATFHAAQTALVSTGRSPRTHADVLRRFGQEIIVEGGFARAHGKSLHKLFDQRNAADYSDEGVDSELAAEAVVDAERFVDSVEEWLDERTSG